MNASDLDLPDGRVCVILQAASLAALHASSVLFEDVPPPKILAIEHIVIGVESVDTRDVSVFRVRARATLGFGPRPRVTGLLREKARGLRR